MNIIKKLYIILFLFVFSALIAQTVKCNFCKKNIDAEYLVVDGNPYHNDHFKCANCNKPIGGNYYSKDGRYFDNKCYEKLFLPKCAVCSTPINGKYLVDSYGVKVHKYHENKLNYCDNCNRIISEKTTRGGVKYSDGRNICKLCYNKKLNSYEEYTRSLDVVINRLNNYGLRFNKSKIKLKIVDLNKLQQISKNRYSKSIRGFTFTSIEVVGSKKIFQHTVYILSRIPSKYAESTIAHELMHIWISENLEHKLSSQLEEGSCNYISYTYLKSDYSSDAKDIIKQLYNNPDKIYGGGYRKVYEKFRGRDFNLFLNYLRKNTSI
ncbi:MAG: protein DA1 [Melioribacteraceae bacterium]|nr:protein DA1 [Melioribacteraceae bacterium]